MPSASRGFPIALLWWPLLCESNHLGRQRSCAHEGDQVSLVQIKSQVFGHVKPSPEKLAAHRWRSFESGSSNSDAFKPGAPKSDSFKTALHKRHEVGNSEKSASFGSAGSDNFGSKGSFKKSRNFANSQSDAFGQKRLDSFDSKGSFRKFESSENGKSDRSGRLRSAEDPTPAAGGAGGAGGAGAAGGVAATFATARKNMLASQKNFVKQMGSLYADWAKNYFAKMGEFSKSFTDTLEKVGKDYIAEKPWAPWPR